MHQHEDIVTHLHFCPLWWSNFIVINLDLSRWHPVQTLLNNSQTLTHFLHTTQVPETRKQTAGGYNSISISQQPQATTLGQNIIALIYYCITLDLLSTKFPIFCRHTLENICHKMSYC